MIELMIGRVRGMGLRQWCCRLIIILLIYVHHHYQDCYALASTSIQVFSRRNDGRSQSFSFDEPTISDISEQVADGNSQVQFRLHQVGREIAKPTLALNHVQSALRSTFLPSIPNSSTSKNILSSSGYLQYILFDNVQDLCTSLRSVLATQRILEGVGVGRADATALSATLNFLIRDGCGMLASLLFTSYASKSFGRNVKRWKYFADVMVDIGITLEIVAPSVLSSPALSRWFLPLICLGNVCKALCGVAAGATGGEFQLYWSNTLFGTQDGSGISEVTAKSGAQRTVMGGVGLVMAGLLAKCLGRGDVGMVLWISLYCALTSIHLMANRWSLKIIAFDWLNSWRLHFIVDQFLNSKLTGSKLSTPKELSKIEPLLFLPQLERKKPMCPVEMGVSFNRFARLSHHTSASLQTVMTQRQKQRDAQQKYFLTVGHAGRKRAKHKRRILVALDSECSNKDVAKAYLHACLVGRELESTSKQHNDVEEIEIVKEVEVKAEKKLARLWSIFEVSASNAGWNLDKTSVTEGFKLYFE